MNLEGDVVLIYYHDKPTVYARIEAIYPDIKKDWYQVSMLLLTIPPQIVNWILREEYFNGAPFTMGGVPMLIKEVEKAVYEKESKDTENRDKKRKDEETGKIIPFKTHPK